MEQPIPKMKRPIWDYLFYLSLLILTVWLILKVTGVINTPVWLEYGVPIGSFILTFLTMFQSWNNRFSELIVQVARVESTVVHHDKDLERLKETLSAK